MKKKGKIIHILISVICSMLVVGMIIIDFNPFLILNRSFQFVLYMAPLIILVLDMIWQIRKAQDKEEKNKIIRGRLTLIFVLYLLILATLLFFSSSYRLATTWNRENLIPIFSKENIDRNMNLIPFGNIIGFMSRYYHGTIKLSIVVTNMIGNIMAFAPFGYFIPKLYGNKIKNGKQFFLFIIGIAICVEIVQFLTRVGQADIDDVILNVLGACLLFGFVKKIEIRKSKNKKIK